jgi:hypothetical protein
MASQMQMTIREARDLFAGHGLDVSTRTVQRLAESGKLPHLWRTSRGEYIFDRSEVLLYLVGVKQPKAEAS